MNLSEDKRRFQGGDSGAGGSLGTAAHAGPAHPMTVGAVGFGPAWTMEDSMAASIVRLEQEAEELRATNALAEQERAILVREMERLREQIADYRNTIESLRDQLCADKCRDKAAADGGWANI
jgi:chromosome segregation ATPase